MPTSFSSYVAIGDSFTECVGDELPDGSVRGWADLVAVGLALQSAAPVGYANLAIRGKLLGPIIAQQLDAALALRPALLSINGGGNDIMRPRVSIDDVAEQLLGAVDRAHDRGVTVLLVSGANPSRQLPLGSLIEARGDRLSAAVRGMLPREGVTYVDNWADAALMHPRYWSRDRLHLGPLGHERVASNVLAALGIFPPVARVPNEPDSVPERQRTAEYWREYVFPWIGRRLTGRSSGDNRSPKSATLQPVEPPRPV